MTAPVYPKSLWLPAGYTGLHARLQFNAALLHTNGGPSSAGSLLGWWKTLARAGSHIGAHYQVKVDGSSEVYVDPALVIYHAYSASEWALGLETQDNNNPNTPWSEPQMVTIAGILVFHGVPPVRLKAPSAGNGVGYHREYTEWNGSGHYCPGTVREAQIQHVLDLMAHHAPSPKPLPSPPVHTYPPFPGTLQLGSTGLGVHEVQAQLASHGHPTVVVDGQFGPLTQIAVRHFQADHHLLPDGIVGPETWHVLFTS